MSYEDFFSKHRANTALEAELRVRSEEAKAAGDNDVARWSADIADETFLVDAGMIIQFLSERKTEGLLSPIEEEQLAEAQRFHRLMSALYELRPSKVFADPK